MKIKTLLLGITLVSFATAYVGCKKTSVDTQDYETTFELSGDQALTENFTEDASDVFMEVAVDNNVAGNLVAQTVESNNILACATVTITPAQGFPKTIVIDFGNGCTSPNGIFRSGKINVVLSDSLRRSGSTAVMTFTNYYVNLYKIEGTITWTNTSTPGVKSWQRKTENGKITAPDGRYWLHNGIRNVVQTAGVNTPFNLLDDVFSITGNHTVTNAAGNSRTCTILEALQKKTACRYIDKGKLKVEGPNHYAVINFGDGTCDNIATISINGRPERTFILR